jgi:hypothetical protein
VFLDGQIRRLPHRDGKLMHMRKLFERFNETSSLGCLAGKNELQWEVRRALKSPGELRFLNEHILESGSIQQCHRLGRGVCDLEDALLALHLAPVLEQRTQACRAKERRSTQLDRYPFRPCRNRFKQGNLKLIGAFAIDAARNDEFMMIALGGFFNVHMVVGGGESPKRAIRRGSRNDKTRSPLFCVCLGSAPHTKKPAGDNASTELPQKGMLLPASTQRRGRFERFDA